MTIKGEIIAVGNSAVKKRSIPKIRKQKTTVNIDKNSNIVSRVDNNSRSIANLEHEMLRCFQLSQGKLREIVASLQSETNSVVNLEKIVTGECKEISNLKVRNKTLTDQVSKLEERVDKVTDECRDLSGMKMMLDECLKDLTAYKTAAASAHDDELEKQRQMISKQEVELSNRTQTITKQQTILSSYMSRSEAIQKS